MSNVGLSWAPRVELLKRFQLSMAGRGGPTFRGVGRRKPRIKRQERGKRKVMRLSKSKHITYKVGAVKKGGICCLNGKTYQRDLRIRDVPLRRTLPIPKLSPNH